MVAVHYLSYELGEAPDDLRGSDVSHRFGERSEAREIEERDREPQLRRGVGPIHGTGVFREVQEHVFPQRSRHPSAVEVEHRGLDQRAHPPARDFRRRDHFRAREAGVLQPLMDVKVEQVRFGLGDARECVHVDSHHLK